jgi:hypothetical protein
MGVVRALVVVVIVAVAASPLISGWFGTSPDAKAVYADSISFGVRGKHDERDKEKKDQNSSSDEDEKGNRIKTADEKKADKDQQQKDNDLPRNDTNTLARDNFELEGNVVRLNCDATPKEIVITTLDGEATLYQGPRDTNRNNRSDRLYCGDLLVGDYVFVHEASKRDEHAYDAYYVSCEQDRQEGPDNTNDNEDDIDPNCTHIFGR